MIRSETGHSVFFKSSSLNKVIYLVIYVDDIVITGNDQEGIKDLKQHLYSHFQTKALGRLCYFHGIVAQPQEGIAIFQGNVLDILEEIGMLECKLLDTPMDPNVKLLQNQGEPYPDQGRYRRLVGKLNYLTMTRPDILFDGSVVTVSQFLNSPCDSHWNFVVRILRYIKGSREKGLVYSYRGHTNIVGYSYVDWAGDVNVRKSTLGYCFLMGGNLISWKSKKQIVVTRTSNQAEYRGMARATCELLWLKHLLEELKFCELDPMELMRDNQLALYLFSNPVFHERYNACFVN